MYNVQCCFLNAPLSTAAVRVFQMAGQVCQVTLGGIQPTGGPPPVLCPCAASWCAPEAPAWPADKGMLAGAVSLPGVLVPTCGLLRFLCPLGCVSRMLRGGREAQLNSGSEAEVRREPPFPVCSLLAQPSAGSSDPWAVSGPRDGLLERSQRRERKRNRP